MFGLSNALGGRCSVAHFWEHGLRYEVFFLAAGTSSWRCVWRNIIREFIYEGHHNGLVQQSLRYGIILFIFSEILFYVGFFWASFHNSISPPVEIGSIWPSKETNVLKPWRIPNLSTERMGRMKKTESIHANCDKSSICGVESVKKGCNACGKRWRPEGGAKIEWIVCHRSKKTRLGAKVLAWFKKLLVGCEQSRVNRNFVGTLV